MITDKLTRYNSLYMDIAERISKMSFAVRLQVGCILVKDGNIISFGWNGMPSGFDNNCEDVEFMPFDSVSLDATEIWHQWPLEGRFWISGQETVKRYRLKTKDEVLHAEANCLMKLAKTAQSTSDATMFCTHAPCLQCAKLIHQSGIKKLYYRDTYRDRNGLDFLAKGGVEVEQFNNNSQINS